MTTPATAVAPTVFVNGARVTVEHAVVSVRDRGFTLADGLFETMHVRRGVIFRLEQHLRRLLGGLHVLQIDAPRDLRAWIEMAVAQAGPHEMSVRVTVTRGPGPGGLTPPPDTAPTVVVAVNPLPAFSPAIYREGLRAVIASGRRNPRAITNGVKTLAYTDAVVAWLEAQRAGADEAIFLDTDDHCSEATASNLFAYRAGVLLTPPLSCAALPGITRATVLELAHSLSLPVEERAFALPELTASDEAFLTSSLRGIAPLRSVDGQPLRAAPGPVTQRLAAAYRALVDRECGAS